MRIVMDIPPELMELQQQVLERFDLMFVAGTCAAVAVTAYFIIKIAMEWRQ